MGIEKVEIKRVTQSRTNAFHVPVKQWGKWSPAARQVFNEVYSSMRNNQYVFMHPKATLLSRTQWETPSWNAAWTAADAVDRA